MNNKQEKFSNMGLACILVCILVCTFLTYYKILLRNLAATLFLSTKAKMS